MRAWTVHMPPIPATGVSTSWSGKAVTGEPITIRLIPERQALPAG